MQFKKMMRMMMGFIEQRTYSERSYTHMNMKNHLALSKMSRKC